MSRIAFTVVFSFALAVTAETQEVTAGVSAYAPFGIDDLDGKLPVSAEIRVTIPVTERFAIEPFVTAGRTQPRGPGVEGFYGLQIRQIVGRFTGGYTFATYGVAGYHSRYGYHGPVIGHFGLGVKQRIAKYLSFRPEVHVVSYHVVPIGARFVAGLSLDRGH